LDLLSSGTFAAAREAAVHQIPAMAISHLRRSDVVRSWEHAPRWLESTLLDFKMQLDQHSDSPLLWNVNLPAIDPTSDPPPRQRCQVDRCRINREARIEESNIRFAADFHGRPREKGTDVDRCFAGSLTISELRWQVC
jgi:5'-nucleotidase